MTFGQALKAFDPIKLTDIVEVAIEDDDGIKINVRESKAYTNQYFLRISNSSNVLFWDALNQKMIILSMKQVLENYITKDICGTVLGESVKFNVSKWFFSSQNRKRFTQTINLNKDIIFNEEGTHYINRFLGFLHKNVKTYDSCDTMSSSGVTIIWNHVLKVICKGDKNKFKYIHDWIIHTCCGQKLFNSGICLRSKDRRALCVIDFILDKVIGKRNSLWTNTPKDIIGKNNGSQIGKILVVIEKSEESLDSDWKDINNELHNTVSSKKIKIHNGTETLELDNICNHIILCHENNTHFHHCFLNVIIDDEESDLYYSTIDKYLNNDSVGEAFYLYCKEHVHNSNFNDAIKPKIAETIDIKLDVCVQFIIETFINKKKSIRMKFKFFKASLDAYCISKDVKTYGLKNLKIKLNSIFGETCIVNRHNCANVMTINYEKIRNIFVMRRWIPFKKTLQSNRSKKDIDDEDEVIVFKICTMTMSEISKIVK